MLDVNDAINELVSRNQMLTNEEKKLMDAFVSSIKGGRDKDLRRLIRPFNEIVRTRFVSNGIMLYSAVISFAIELIADFPKLRAYLQAIYPVVPVDEAQDTNCLCYIFLRGLLSDTSEIYLFGDSAQRVYGFIGAMPEFRERASRDFDLTFLRLKNNHRFPKESMVGELGAAFRSYLEGGIVENEAKLPLYIGITQQNEAATVAAKISELIQRKIAVLVRKRGTLANLLIGELNQEHITYFNGLFSDTSHDFLNFNSFVLSKISEKASGKNELTRLAADRLLMSISEELLSGIGGFEYGRSYAMLLDALRTHLMTDCALMIPSDRYSYIRSIFSEGSVRRYSDYLDTAVSIMTVHSSKGLEWDNVFLPGLTRFDWPGALCGECRESGICMRLEGETRSENTDKMPYGLAEEVGLLYVGVTRARRSIYMSASRQRMTKSGNYQLTYPSCLTLISGVAHVEWSEMDAKD